MSYLHRLTRMTKSPAADYHLLLLKKPKSRNKVFNYFKESPLSEIIADLQALEEDMAVLERKYHCSSEQIYHDYVQGKEPEDDDFILDFGEWASIYQMWLACQDEYFKAYQEQLSTFFPLPLAA